jgi:chaperonin GroEL
MSSELKNVPAAKISKESVKIQSNILSSKESRIIINNVIDEIYNILSVTLGPGGSNVLIEKMHSDHIITKDGYTVLNNLAFNGKLERTILNFFQKISGRLNSTVGDGTTSAVLIAINLYKGLQQFIAENKSINRQTIIKDFKEIAAEIAKDITKIAYKPTEKEEILKLIKNVAKVSTNFDKDIYENIYQAYEEIGEEGTLLTVPSPTNKTFFESSSGFSHLRGMILPCFANQQGEQKWKAAGSIVVAATRNNLNGSHIQKISEMINYVINSCKRPLLIMAPSFDNEVLNFLYTNKIELKDRFNVCAVDIAIKSPKAKNIYNDLINFVSISKSFEEFFGIFEKGIVNEAIISKQNTILKIDKNNFSLHPCISSAINLIQTNIILLEGKLGKGSTNTINEEIRMAKKRINNLSANNLITLYIGGDSIPEKKTRSYLAEDAIHAVKSALKYGVTQGSNLSVLYTLWNKKDSDIEIDKYESELMKIITDSYIKIFNQIIINYRGDYKIDSFISELQNERNKINSFDVRKLCHFQKFKNMSPISNSAETDIRILEAVVSIVSLLLDTKGFVSTSGFMN